VGLATVPLGDSRGNIDRKVGHLGFRDGFDFVSIHGRYFGSHDCPWFQSAELHSLRIAGTCSGRDYILLCSSTVVREVAAKIRDSV
jgi:hypothetical protein